MTLEVLLLNQDETIIRWLDQSKMSLVEHQEQKKLTHIDIEYPLSEDVMSDIHDFKPGNKIFVSGFEGVGSKLYVINESIENNIWANQNIKLTVEDVLTELNYTPLITQYDIQGDNTEHGAVVNITPEKLKEWFGYWYNIGEYEEPERLTVIMTGSMTRMEFLRLIENQTGNHFSTRYELNKDNNIIIRYLDFKSPVNNNYTHDLITINYNADNIIYKIDESKSFKAMAPIIKENKSRDEIDNWDNLNTTLKKFRELNINVGDKVPYLISQEFNTKYPKDKEGKLIAEGLLNENYWRRQPGDSTYSWYQGLFKPGNSISDATQQYLKEPAKHEGEMCSCAKDGDYKGIGPNGEKDYTFYECKVNDIFVCNGEGWDIIRQRYNNITTKFVYALAFWNAPFVKRNGEFFIQNTNKDNCHLNYKEIRSRGDWKESIPTADVSDDSTEVSAVNDVKVGDSEEIDYGPPFIVPKIGSKNVDGANEYWIYTQLCRELKNKDYPKLSIKANVKDILYNESSLKYNLYDNIPVKINSFDSLLGATVIKTTKNLHTKECIIELDNADIDKPHVLQQPYLEMHDGYSLPNTAFTFKGRLLVSSYVKNDKGEIVLKETPLVNKLISVALIAPSSTDITITTTVSTPDGQPTATRQNWDMYGRSPDKSLICGIGKYSAGKDSKNAIWWKGVFRNRCVRCGHSGTLYWGYNRRNTYNPITNTNWPLRKWGHNEGEFTCGNCGADYSVQGWEKINGSNARLIPFDARRTPTPLFDREQAYQDALELVEGRYLFKETVDKARTYIKSKPIAGSVHVYTVVTNNKGEFSLKLNLPGLTDEKYTFTVNFAGDEEYAPCSYSVRWDVPKAPTKEFKYRISATKPRLPYINIPRADSVIVSGPLNVGLMRPIALQIIGDQRGLSAIKAIANWVALNINYERQMNFYQSPESTLLRRVGNCCCKTDLFMHLCEAVNLHEAQQQIEGYQLEYIWSPGHVYARCQDKFVDVTLGNRYKWGARMKEYPPAEYTRFPRLPFIRGY